MTRQGRSSEYGNIFILLFAAVGMVGLLGASMSYILRGPVKTMGDVTRRTVAENSMIASSRLAVLMSPQLVAPPSGDCDADGFVEPVPFRAAGGVPYPAGGGLLPTTIGATLTDSWKTEFGYCVWDHGSAIDDAGCGGAPQLRLRGGANGTYSVLAVISAGPNRAFETSCNDFVDANTDLVPDTPLVNKPSGSDDLIMSYTYNEANSSVAGGIWKLKTADPSTAEIAKDLEVKDSGGTVRVSVDSTTGVGDFYGITTDLITPKTGSSIDVDGGMALNGSMTLTGENTWTTVNVATFSDTQSSTILGTRARGTIAAPSDPLLNDLLASFQGRVVGAGTWGGMVVAASENHTPAARGIDLRFITTLNGTLVPTEKMRITNDGLVGIGTTSPSGFSLGTLRRVVNIEGGDNGSAEINLEANGTSTGANPTVSFAQGATQVGYVRSERSTTGATDGAIAFATHNGTSLAERARITPGGSVGIGTSTPSTRLDVAGEVKIGTGSTACSSTVEGAIRYNSGQVCLEMCDGAIWRCIQASPCASNLPAAISFTNLVNQATNTLVTSNIVQVTGIASCVVGVSVSGQGNPEYRTCSDAACASVIQGWTTTRTSISNNQYLQMRLTSAGAGNVTYSALINVGARSTNWTVSTDGNCADPSPPIGTFCADGTVYIGLSPDGGTKMYATPCVHGQSWSGSTCTGGVIDFVWSNNITVQTNIQNATTGESNTVALAGLSNADSPYSAAQVCNSLVFGGQSDWYLPSQTEAAVLQAACATYPGAGCTGPYYHWTSREAQVSSVSYAVSWRMNNGTTGSFPKTNLMRIICVRKD